MRLSEMITREAAARDRSLNSLSIQVGLHPTTLSRLAVRVKAMPTPETAARLADLLRVRPVVVVLAAAEELGVYDPAEDGRLVRRAGVPQDVQRALADLEQAVAANLDRP